MRHHCRRSHPRLSLLTGFVLAGVSLAGQSAKAAAPTFSKDVARILLLKCATCHRSGEVAPMSLLTYEATRPWTKAIKAKVLSREMPPWFADPSASVAMKNDRRLSQQEIDTITAWVDAGAPKGNDADAPPQPAFVEGWHHPSGRPPDLVIEMTSDFHVPAEGEVPYQDFFVKVPFEGDRWAEAIEARPGNPAAVHHNRISFRDFPLGVTPTDGAESRLTLPARPRAEGNGVPRGVPNYLAAYAPGHGIDVFEPGIGRRLHGGPNTYVQFNNHYQPTGKPEVDRSMVGIWFSQVPIRKEAIYADNTETLIVNGRQLPGGAGMYGQAPIPPYADDYKVVGVTTFAEPVTIHHFFPHAHLRGKDFTYVVVYPDGREQTVLTVPRFDFNWQLVYEVKEPLAVPAGSKLVSTAHYDNSLRNRYNPSPEKPVYWSEQSWDEMFIPHTEYTLDTQDLTTTPGPPIPRTSDGRPDLQGTWDFAQLTPLERPGNFAGKQSLTDDEAEEFAQQRIETGNKDRRDGGAAADVERAYNDFWWDFGTRVAKQTSLVVDPPDGRIPPMTSEAQKRLAQARGHYDNPEERPLAERCIVGFNSGPPMVPSAYNNNMQLVQTRDHVAILNEMIHSARIVDLNRREHRPTDIRFLTGDAIGHWDGDTLVVDTANFSSHGGFRGASANLHLIERFTRVDRNALRYEFTVDDPATWTKSWTASIPMARTDDLMFEYACHEANYALEGVLKGARYQEKQPKAPK